MENMPNKIYLIVGDECPDDIDFKQLSEVTWSSNRNFKNDIEYINVASLREAIEKEIQNKEKYHKGGYSIAFIGGIEKVLELLDTVNPKN